MRQPGSIFHNVPPRNDDPARALRDLEREVRMQGSAQSGQAMQIGAGGLLVNNGGSVAVEGDGQVTVNGLPLSAVMPSSSGGSLVGLPVPTTPSVAYTVNVAVPAGYGTALVMAVCQFDVWNPTSSSIYAYGGVNIAGATGAQSDASVAPGNAATITPAAIGSVDVSELASFPISVAVQSSVALPSSTSNMVTVNAITIFIE